jgi:hypothetical protein
MESEWKGKGNEIASKEWKRNEKRKQKQWEMRRTRKK